MAGGQIALMGNTADPRVRRGRGSRVPCADVSGHESQTLDARELSKASDGVEGADLAGVGVNPSLLRRVGDFDEGGQDGELWLRP
jgi:hypothetical protein